MAHETHFTDGTEITSYLAIAYAEGFCEGDDASREDQIKAWSYLCGTRVGYSLQGWFGRTIREMIRVEILDDGGTVNWDIANEYFIDNSGSPTRTDDPNDEQTDDESYTNMEEL